MLSVSTVPGTEAQQSYIVLPPRVTTSVGPVQQEPIQGMVLEVRKENGLMTAVLIRTEPKCDLSLTKASLSSVSGLGVLFQPWAGHPGAAAVLPTKQASPPITSLRHSGALCSAGLRLPGAGGRQEARKEAAPQSKRARKRVFGKPQRKLSAPCILQVLPKEAAPSLPSPSATKRVLGEKVRPPAALGLGVFPLTAGRTPAGWCRHFSSVPEALSV